MEMLNIDPVVALLLTGLVAGVIELVKRLYAKDWYVAIIIVAAGIAGGLGALLVGIPIITGIVVGLSTSGYITIAQNIGDNA